MTLPRKALHSARAVAVLGLLADAVVHLRVAGNYDANQGSLLSEGDVFRVQAVVAVLVAVVVVWARRRWIDALAFLVAASAAAAVVMSRYVDLGPLPGLPDLFEPSWYGAKTFSAVAELVAAIALLVLCTVRVDGPAPVGPPRP